MEVEDTLLAPQDAETPTRRKSNSNFMSEEEQRERRASIQSILQDDQLTPTEKRKSIQSLMDGRRRSSADAGSRRSSMTSSSHHNGVTSIAAAAAAAAAFYDSDADTDCLMSDEASSSSSSESSFVCAEDALVPPTRLGRSTSLKIFTEGDKAAAYKFVSPNPSRHMEKTRPECNHYERNCTIVSPCCGLAFGCRICHDECPVLPSPMTDKNNTPWGDATPVDGVKQSKKRRSLPMAFEEEETHHQIDRFAIQEVICRNCYTRQSSKRNQCETCKVQFGAYHCNICNLWMSNDEFPYHCEDCGFCRVGGRENFQHCHDCGMCIDAQLFDDHNCKAGKYMSNCPVCQEDLFSSRYASHEMPCGHAIHWHCFKELTSYDTRCPVCKKTAETPEQMAPTWSAMAMGIALQPVPVELARAVTIICNDCEERQDNRRWHFLGVQCSNCQSFNTTVERIILMGREAATFLDEVDARNGVSPPNHGMNDSLVPTDVSFPVGAYPYSYAEDEAMNLDASLSSMNLEDSNTNTASRNDTEDPMSDPRRSHLDQDV